MRLQYLLAPAVFAASALGANLVDTLRSNGLELFADQLESNPVGDTGSNLIVYAPSDSGLASSNGPGRVKREPARSQNGYYFTSQNANKYPIPPRLSSRMLARDLKSGGDAWMTYLDDPAYVNLGWASNQSLVERPSDCNCARGKHQVFTGRGASVKVTGDDIPFDDGVIRPIDGDLTLPESLSSTLPYLGVNKFHDLVKKSGLLSELDSTAGITVLAPDNSVFKNVTNWSDKELVQLIKCHILVDFPAYTPLLEDGLVYPTLAGGKVKVTVRDGTIYLNGAKILAGDAIAVNGAIHTIDRVLDTLPGPAPVPEPTKEPEPTYASVPTQVYVPTPVTGAARTLDSLSWKGLALSAMGVVATTHYWM